MDRDNEVEQEDMALIADWISEGNPNNWDPEVSYSEYRLSRSDDDGYREDPSGPQKE